MHHFRPFSLACLLAAFLLFWLTAPGGDARAAGDAPAVTYVSWLGQGLGSASSRQPDATQSVTVYARSDTNPGENVCL